MAHEEFTMTDKAQRDRLFNQLRNSTEANERQAVKFSSVEPVLGEDGKQLPGPAGWRTTWSVAHPALA